MKKSVIWGAIGIGAVAIVGGLAYAGYRYLTENPLCLAEMEDDDDCCFFDNEEEPCGEC